MSEPAPVGRLQSFSQKTDLPAIAYGFLWAGIFASIGAVSWWLFRPTTVLAETQILLIQTGQRREIAAFDPVDVPSHVVRLRSTQILSRAVNRRELHLLKTFTHTDEVVAKLGKMITVERLTSREPSRILVIRCRGPVAEDCVTILKAVTESYQDFLDVTYRSDNDRLTPLLERGQQTIEKDLKEAKKSYEDCRKKMPLAVSINEQADKYRLQSLQQKLVEIEVNRAEVRVILTTAERNPDSLGVKMQSREWAVKSGYDGLPEEDRKSTTLVAAHIQHLKNQVETLDAVEATLKTSIRKQLETSRDTQLLEIEERRLRENVARLETLYENTVKRLGEINRSEPDRVEIRVLEPPKIVR